MIMRIYRLPFVQRLLARRRENRARFMLSKVDTFPGMRVLDIGCGRDGKSLENFLPPDYHITGIDLHDENETRMAHPNFTYLRQDARDMSRFKDKEFDLAISVGMMEHICNRSDLEKMASEIARVAQQYIIVVPWRYAWLEPHFMLPFFPLYPSCLQVWLTRALNLNSFRGGVLKNPDAIKEGYQWLTNRQWEAVYPGAKAHICPTLETVALVRKTA